MLAKGTKVVIPIPGMVTPTEATHEVVGHDPKYLWICPVEKVADLPPFVQFVNPVSRITEDRVRVVG